MNGRISGGASKVGQRPDINREREGGDSESRQGERERSGSDGQGHCYQIERNKLPRDEELERGNPSLFKHSPAHAEAASWRTKTMGIHG